MQATPHERQFLTRRFDQQNEGVEASVSRNTAVSTEVSPAIVYI